MRAEDCRKLIATCKLLRSGHLDPHRFGSQDSPSDSPAKKQIATGGLSARESSANVPFKAIELLKLFDNSEGENESSGRHMECACYDGTPR